MSTKLPNLLNDITVRKDELKSYIDVLLHYKRQHQKKFIIFAHYRSGSTLLSSLINSHPEVLCEREIFLPFMYLYFKKVFFPNLYINSRLVDCKEKNYGFILRLSQLNHILTKYHGEPHKFIKNLYKNGWKIIYLKRENYLKQAISNRIQLRRGQAHDTKEKPMHKKIVNISTQKLMKDIEFMEDYSIKEDQIIDQFEHLKIIYERDLLDSKNHQKTCDKIFDYLGLDGTSVSSNFRKVSSDNLADYIENFDEVAEFLKGTKHEEYLYKL